MLRTKVNFFKAILVAILTCGIAGCQNLPGTKQSQGAVIGGLGGAAVGAAIGHNALGAVLGGALGAGAGYVVGANSDRIMGRDQASAAAATQNAQTRPATAQDVMNSTTADLNKDGFVTLDEVAAMRAAGLSDDQMLQRLRATNQIFELTPSQQSYLRDRGVSNYVINQMQTINQDKRQQLLNTMPNQNNVISQPTPR
ncbi:MAG: hypothetical protein JWR19_590 [Pedosphaera sp.]|nr:hypothetical protein [Pedosphaera sp.]